MKIKNHQRLAVMISEWLKERLSKGDGKTAVAVLGLSGGIDSALVALLCKYGSLKHICVNMPCHSSLWSIERSVNLTKDYGLNLISVDATAAADSVSGQVAKALGKEGARSDLAGLFSCIRAPILDYVSKCAGGRIVGTGNRDEDYIVRYFSKRGDGAVDLSPIADLHKSEVKQLFAWLAEMLNGGIMAASASAILEAKPSADLWGGQAQYDEDELGLTYDQVEWADCFVGARSRKDFWSLGKDAREKLIKGWVRKGSCSVRDSGIIARVSEIELSSKHKANPNIPVCRVHDQKGLFE